MAKASSLITRNNSGSQLPSANQLWVIQASDGSQYQLGFDKEFVKKHLFVDPDPPADIQIKAAGIVQKVNAYGHLTEAVPLQLDASTLRFLKLKKLVLARTVQGTCSVCHRKETEHELVCVTCQHKHKKPWSGGGPCSATCGCASWVPCRAGLPSSLGVCAKFVENQYDIDRILVGKANPFGGPGGACTGTNTVVLMDEVDLVKFKDVVVGAVKTAGTWSNNEKKEGLELNFGVGSVATIESNDDFATFNSRAKAKGIAVDAQRRGDVYKIYHFRAVIA